MEYFGVKNFEKFQHYKSGAKSEKPTWIKLYVSVLHDYDFNSLSTHEQAVLMKLWVLAGTADNHLPLDINYISRAIQIKRVRLENLFKSGFLVKKGLAPKKSSQSLALEENINHEYKQENINHEEEASSKPRLSFGYSSSDLMQAEMMQGHIVQVIPDFRTTNGNSVEEWAEQIHEMRTCDRRSYAAIADMWEYARGHNWWRSRILSPASLRKHWNTLSAQRNDTKQELNGVERMRKRDEEHAEKMRAAHEDVKRMIREDDERDARLRAGK